MKARTLKIGEFVCVDIGEYIGQGEIVSIDGKKKDFHFSGDEMNVDVEIRIKVLDSDILEDDDLDMKVDGVYHFENQCIYQIADGKTFESEFVCYENDDEIEYEYYSPIQGISLNEEDLDGSTERYCSGYDYVQHQIKSGRWDLDSDTFDLEEALADAFDEGFAQGQGR